MEAIKITEKSAEVFNYVKGNGGRVSVEEICEATGRAARSINANVTDLVKKGLAEREKVEVEGKEKPCYLCLPHLMLARLLRANLN